MAVNLVSLSFNKGHITLVTQFRVNESKTFAFPLTILERSGNLFGDLDYLYCRFYNRFFSAH